eukprot:31215-Eustigmatos_ZCMA.PRE.1
MDLQIAANADVAAGMHIHSAGFPLDVNIPLRVDLAVELGVSVHVEMLLDVDVVRAESAC